jgi:hypothetical protein
MTVTRSMEACCHLQQVDANPNIVVIHDIGKTSSVAIMEVSDTNDND